MTAGPERLEDEGAEIVGIPQGRRDPRTYRMPVRLGMVTFGLALNGVGIGLLAVSQLGFGAWDVLHDGIAEKTPLSFGTVVILVTAALLVFWWPLRERPGIGTLLNVFIAGPVIDLVIAFVPPVVPLWARLLVMCLGIVIFALGQGMYLAPGLGAGAREGLMTGLNRVFGWSMRLSRFLIEVAVLVLGILLGGAIGLATIVFTIAVGPLVQWAMVLFNHQAD